MGATTKAFNSKSSSFVKFHLHGRTPYDVFNADQQLSVDSVESEIKAALNIKPKNRNGENEAAKTAT